MKSRKIFQDSMNRDELEFKLYGMVIRERGNNSEMWRQSVNVIPKKYGSA